MISDRHQLANTLRAMKEGEMMRLPRVTYLDFWPRPGLISGDDYKSDEQRAKDWCNSFDVDVFEEVGEKALRFHKRSRPRQAAPSNSSEEFGSQEHSVIMDAILGRGDY